MPVDFGDNVRVRDTEETVKVGIAGKVGQVYGTTTPSITGVEILGPLTQDYAINVYFQETEIDYWVSEELVEFVDHGAGTEVVAGNIRATKNSDGSWTEDTIKTKKWWYFWV